MPKKTLFAYAAGTDLDDVVDAVEARLDALVATRKWVSKDVWVVNQREPPNWDLGLNLALTGARSKGARWTDDVVAIATELASIHHDTGRNFVIGIHDADSDRTTDLFTVDTDKPDLDQLRSALTRD